MKILIFGERGQIATNLKNLCPKGLKIKFLGRKNLNIEEYQKIPQVIQQSAPDLSINAAAYTDVDGAEKNYELAQKVNALAPKQIAIESKRLNIPFIHFSTDYVLNNESNHSSKEGALPQPLNAYGRSKLEGEKNIVLVDGLYMIIRSSWVFSLEGTNFLKTILSLAQNHKSIDVIDDQFGGPTPASEIAKICYKIISNYQNQVFHKGIYHFSGFPDVSWAEFASEIIAQAKLTTEINPVSTTFFMNKNNSYEAVRPLNSRLDCSLIHDFYDIERPCWKSILQEMMQGNIQDSR